MKKQKKNPKKETNLYQTIILDLDDGSKAVFTGPAQIFKEGIKVVKVTVTTPVALPPMLKFGPIEE
jgi:hypothetical protein